MKVKVYFDNAEERYKIYNGDTVINATEVTINEIPIDEQLSDTSANAVENRAVKKALDDNKSYSQEIVGSLNEKVDANKSDSDNKVSTLRTDTELGLNALNSRIDEVIGQGMRLIKGTDISWTWNILTGTSSNFQLPANTVVFIAVPKGCHVLVQLNNSSTVCDFGNTSSTETQVGMFVTGSNITNTDNFNLIVYTLDNTIIPLVEANTTLLIADSPQELKDIRVDYYGVTHATAGDSVRSILDKLSEVINYNYISTINGSLTRNITTTATTTGISSNYFSLDVSELENRDVIIKALVRPFIPENFTKIGLEVRGYSSGGNVLTQDRFYEYPYELSIPTNVATLRFYVAFEHDTLDANYNETFNCSIGISHDMQLQGNKLTPATITGDKLADATITGDKLADGSVLDNKISNSQILDTMTYGTGTVSYINDILTINYTGTSGYNGGGFKIPLYKGVKTILKAHIDSSESYNQNGWYIIGDNGTKTFSHYGATSKISGNDIILTIPADVRQTAGDNVFLVNTSAKAGYITLSNILNFAGYVLDHEYLGEFLESLDYPKYKNKKILFLGDSVTALTGNRGWTTHFNNIINPSLSVNIAVPSSRWCDYSDTVYDGNPVWDGEDHNHNNTMGNQIEKILRGKDTTHPNYSRVEDYQDFDIIMIAEGSNDAIPTEDIEPFFTNDNEVVDIATVDKTKLAGAFRYAIENLQRIYPNAKIFICTPIQAVDSIRPYLGMKTRGDYLKALSNRISVEYIDTFDCGICGIYEANHSAGRDLTDGLHPNSSGALKIGKYNAKNVINKYI